MADTIITNEHYVPFEMERNHNENIKFRLKITENTTIEKKKTQVIAEIQYLTPVNVVNFSCKPKIVINGEVIVNYDLLDNNFTTTLSASNDYLNLRGGGVSFYHDSSGKLPISVTASIKADEILILEIYQTKGSASYSGTATIDMSVPFVKEMEVSADRYGLNAGANMVVGHSSYPLESVVFKLKGLTEEQAKNRYRKITQATNSSYAQETNGTYTLTLTKTHSLSSLNEIFFDLDAIYESQYPLNTGTFYSYSVTLTAANQQTFKFDGRFFVPQKVTGLECESLINTVRETKLPLYYQVLPITAEEQTVVFSSDNEYVATVDSQGIIYAKNLGSCIISVTTVDGGFVKYCSVNVLNKEAFPQLTTIEYLSEVAIKKIIEGISFLNVRCTEKGMEIPTLPTVVFEGKNHPVKEIRNVLETIEQCCQILKSATNDYYPCSALPTAQNIPKYNTDKQWYLIVNEWVNFLIELNEKTA